MANFSSTVIQREGIFDTLHLFDEVTSVISGVETTIISYTVPIDKTAEIYYCSLSGENVSKFTAYIDGTAVSSLRSYWTEFNVNFLFKVEDTDGLILTESQVFEIKAIHNRPAVSDYEAQIIVKEYEEA